MKGEHYSGRTRSTGTVVFYSIYFVLLAAALSAAVVGLGKLWEFLQHYEACQIYHTIDAVAEELNSGNLGLLLQRYRGRDLSLRGRGSGAAAAFRAVHRGVHAEEEYQGEHEGKSGVHGAVRRGACGVRKACPDRRGRALRIRDIRRGAGLRAFSWCRTRA